MTIPSKTLGIDIGGSGIKGAIIKTETGELLSDRLRLETPAPATLKKISKTVRDLVSELQWSGPIGCTFPAIIDHGHARTTSNIHASCLDADVATALSGKTSCPVTVLNDADAAGVAEMHFGAARNRDGIVVLLTFGTGIGSAVLSNGKLLANTELGQLEFKGTLAEHYVSGRVRKEEELSWKAFAARVSKYLSHLAKTLNPDLFIIGGGVSNPHKAPHWMPLLRIDVPVVPATLRNNAGIVGAALVAARGIVCEGRLRPIQ